MEAPGRSSGLGRLFRDPGMGFAAGGAMIILGLTAFESLYPGFSIHADAISYLGGAGVPTEYYWNALLFVAGVLWLWSSIALLFGRRKPIHSVFFYGTAAGMMTVALFPWNVLPAAHEIGAVSTLLLGAGGCILGGRMAGPQMRRLSYLAAFVSLFAFLSGFLGILALLGPGGVERMDYYPIFLWETAFGGYLLGRSDFQEASVETAATSWQP